jgi:hypothetical protein
MEKQKTFLIMKEHDLLAKYNHSARWKKEREWVGKFDILIIEDFMEMEAYSEEELNFLSYIFNQQFFQLHVKSSVKTLREIQGKMNEISFSRMIGCLFTEFPDLVELLREGNWVNGDQRKRLYVERIFGLR